MAFCCFIFHICEFISGIHKHKCSVARRVEMAPCLLFFLPHLSFWILLCFSCPYFFAFHHGGVAYNRVKRCMMVMWLHIRTTIRIVYNERFYSPNLPLRLLHCQCYHVMLIIMATDVRSSCNWTSIHSKTSMCFSGILTPLTFSLSHLVSFALSNFRARALSCVCDRLCLSTAADSFAEQRSLTL